MELDKKKKKLDKEENKRGKETKGDYGPSTQIVCKIKVGWCIRLTRLTLVAVRWLGITSFKSNKISQRKNGRQVLQKIRIGDRAGEKNAVDIERSCSRSGKLN